MKDGYISIHNSSLSNRQALIGHSDDIFAIKYLGKNYLASASKDKTVRIWNVSSYTCLHILQHNGEVLSLEYLGNGLLASGSKEKTAFIWKFMTGELHKTLVHPEEVHSIVKVNADLIAGGGKSIYLWKISSGIFLGSIAAHLSFTIVMVRIDDQTIATIGDEDEYAKTWNVTTKENIKKIYISNTLSMIAINSSHIAIGSKDNKAVIWDVISNTIIRTLNTATDVKYISKIKNETHLVFQQSNSLTCILNSNNFSVVNYNFYDVRVLLELPNDDLVTGNSGKKLITWRWQGNTYVKNEEIDSSADVYKLELIQEQGKYFPNFD